MPTVLVFRVLRDTGSGALEATLESTPPMWELLKFDDCEVLLKVKAGNIMSVPQPLSVLVDMHFNYLEESWAVVRWFMVYTPLRVPIPLFKGVGAIEVPPDAVAHLQGICYMRVETGINMITFEDLIKSIVGSNYSSISSGRLGVLRFRSDKDFDPMKFFSSAELEITMFKDTCVLGVKLPQLTRLLLVTIGSFSYLASDNRFIKFSRYQSYNIYLAFILYHLLWSRS